MDPVASVEAQAAFDQIRAGFDRLRDLGAAITDEVDAAAWIRQAELVGRRGDSLRCEVVAQIQQGGFHHVDRHANAGVMVRHVAHLSETEARARRKVARALVRLPVIRSEFGAGRLGRCQVERLAHTFANRRVRERFVSRTPTSRWWPGCCRTRSSTRS